MFFNGRHGNGQGPQPVLPELLQGRPLAQGSQLGPQGVGFGPELLQAHALEFNPQIVHGVRFLLSRAFMRFTARASRRAEPTSGRPASL